MKVLHVTGSIAPSSAGVGATVLGLSQAQASLGMLPAIWTLDSNESLRQVAQRQEIQTVALSGYACVGPSHFGFSPQMEKMAGTSTFERFDVLHQHSIWLALSRATNRWRTATAQPTIIAPHGTLEAHALKISWWKKRFALIAYEMNNLRSASCLHATSIHEASGFRQFGLKNPIAVIPNGVPESMLSDTGNAAHFYEKHSIAGDKRIALFLSRLHPIKGIPMLLEAFAQIPQREGWVLVIAGFEDYDRYGERLVQIARSLGILEHTIFVGGLFEQDKRDALAAANLFVLPSYSENFAIVVVESLAAGVPVLTTTGTPWRELVENDCGWWKEASVESIREGLLDAMNRPQAELLAMGQRGKKLVERSYTWPRIADQTMMLYEWLLGRGSQPGFVSIDN